MRKILLTMLMVVLLVACSSQEDSLDLTGYYLGHISVPTGTIGINIDMTHDQELRGVLNIPGQGIQNLTLLETKVEKSQVYFEILMPGLEASFDGVFEGETLSGTYTQSGMDFDFELTKTQKVVYENREAISETIGDVTITGELIVPETEAEMPVVLIIAGSGPTDYNGNSAAGVSANSYLYLAEALEEEGFASLRYNKRILGNNISEADLSFEDFVDDAQYLTEMLKADPRFSEVILVGHSQGALIAEIVATKTEVDKVVALTGAGQTIDQVLMDQLAMQLDPASLVVCEGILNKMKAGEIVEDVPPSLNSLFRESVQPFMISWMAYDPLKVIQDIEVPLMVVVGDVDLQIPVSQGEILRDSGHPLTYRVIEGMNHVLKKTSANVNENAATYSDPNLPIHEDLVEALVEFIK